MFMFGNDLMPRPQNYSGLYEMSYFRCVWIESALTNIVQRFTLHISKFGFPINIIVKLFSVIVLRILIISGIRKRSNSRSLKLLTILVLQIAMAMCRITHRLSGLEMRAV